MLHLLVMAALAGCAAPPEPGPRQAADDPVADLQRSAGPRVLTSAQAQPVSDVPERRETAPSRPARSEAPPRVRTEPAVQPRTAAPTPRRDSTRAQEDEGEQVLLNFVDADIPAVLRVMAGFTKRNFLVDPRVKGQLTLVSEGRVSAGTAYDMLLASLRMAGFAAVDVAGGTRVVPEADAKLQGGPVQSSAAGPGAGRDSEPARAGGEIVTRTFRLSYENAAELVPVLRPMIATNNPITASAGSNSLVVTDYADNVERIGRIIASIDTPTSLSTAVVRLRQGIAVDIADVANQLLDAQAQGGEGTQRIIIVADPRANNVVIRATSPARAKLARDLVLQLDEAQADPDTMHVVYLRNAQASYLAEVLRGVLTGDPGSSGQASGADAAVRAALGAGGMQSGTNNGSNTNSTSSGTNSTRNTSGNTTSGLGSSLRGAAGQGATGAGTGTSSNLNGSGPLQGFAAGGMTVQADATTNALIISGPEPIYRSLRKVIDMLDQRRAQVLVESLIVEVNEDDAAELGIQWMTGNGRWFAGNRSSLGSGINASARTTLDAAPGGLSVGLINGTVNLPGVGEVLNIELLARALQSRSGVNILSTPNLLTLDNEAASIMVGRTLPFVSGQYITDGGGGSNNPFQTVEREDVGLKLNIRPQISEGGTVKLDIYQEVSTLDDVASASLGGVVTNKRAIDTSVLLDDGQIMVLGGLLEDSVQTTRDAVPILGSIPGLGALFRYDRRSRVKTNLMVFLRPYVVRNAQDGRGLTASRYDYMRRAQGRVQPPENWALPDMGSPVLPPIGLQSTRDRQTYDLRPEAAAETLSQPGPESTNSSTFRPGLVNSGGEEAPQPVRTRLPAGLTVSGDPAALYGRPEGNTNILQFTEARTEQEAEQAVQRTRISGLKAYSLTGPGGMGYVVRVDVPRDPRAVDNAVQVLRELGYQPELVVGP
ncbi:general secretion pathway protein D [Bordetella ansorpii]|uniref:General secretion pathway protein D n=1 Tax=Bordetella ansorpii TaxID=288768 RepID=A0A157SS67_9BORD|nr:type II secretion system secretin GspD [Bordetella ansorpii]SAI72983.1 general secretion pathway protein D [Bordetella ansorpii]